MQVSTDPSLHLTYCTNIHPGETWDEVFATLQQYVPPLKAALSPDALFGVGLRLSNAASVVLEQEERLEQFAAWLGDEGLYVFTMNGFPYGGFHGQVVKDRVYAPDWRTPERLAYTLRLARILARLLPEGMEGGVSTSPVSYKGWMEVDERDDAFRTAAHQFADLAVGLETLRNDTGRLVHVDIEPEPDCLIENTAETVDFFERWIFGEAVRLLGERHELDEHDATDLMRRHVRVCYDTCHFAVEYEAPEETFAAFDAAGILVGKVQISAALQVRLPDEAADREVLAARLEPFAESTYLHQVVVRRSDGAAGHYPDLLDALPHVLDPDAREWRIHYHVPLFADHFNGMHSTRANIAPTLERVLRAGGCDHLEVETYTWGVLPDEMKVDLGTSIQRELEWVQATLREVSGGEAGANAGNPADDG